MPRHTPLPVQVHEPSRAEEGAMERAGDLSLDVTVEDDLVIARRPEDPTRDYAVELRVLIRTLADAMAVDTTREKTWDLAEFLMGTVALPHPDWSAIELCARELAELAGRATDRPR